MQERKERWIEGRKQTARKEFEFARKDLQARLDLTRNPLEITVIYGMLDMLEDGIQEVTSRDRFLSPRLVEALIALAHPGIGSQYRKVSRLLRQFDLAEIQSIPEEVVENLAEWQGDEDVGVFILWAAYHAGELAQLVAREYVRDLLAVVKEIADSRRDPASAPADPDLARKWAQLPDAIVMAGIAYDLLEWDCNQALTELTETGFPDQSPLEEAAARAARVRQYLCEAKDAWEEKRAEARRSRAPGGGKPDVSLRGRQLYHHRIRQEAALEKGQFVVIDVDSGDYEVGDTENDAWAGLRERRPDAITWVERVGYPTPYKMVSRPQARR